MKKLMLALMIMSCGGYEDVAEETDAFLGEEMKVTIRAANGQYFAAEGGGGGIVNANRDVAALWETFKLREVGYNLFAISASNDQWVSCEFGRIVANRKVIGPWEKFTRIALPNGKTAFQAHTGQYVVAEGGGGGIVNCNRDAIGAWETLRLNKL
jgi:hypothetical protein